MLHARNRESQNDTYPHRFDWDGDDKKWTSHVFLDNFEFAYKIASENQFYIEPVVEEYARKIKEHRALVALPSVKFVNNKLVFTHLFNEQKIHLEKEFDLNKRHCNVD